jgi:heme exporter protein CcmD
MNPKYAVFIWGSYGLTLAVLLWNAFAPQFRRRELKHKLTEAAELADEAGE